MAEPTTNPPSTRAAWTEREDQILRRAFPNTATGDLSKELKRTLNATRRRARFLGLRKANPSETWFAWAEEEDEIVRSGYANSTAEQLATKLERTADAIRNRARPLGLRKTSNRPRLEDGERVPGEREILAAMEEIRAAKRDRPKDRAPLELTVYSVGARRRNGKIY